MSNLTPKMNQSSIEINLQTVSNVKMNIFQMKIFDKITLHLFIIYSFIKFKVLGSLPKSFHGPLGFVNALQLVNWPFYWSQFNWVKQTDNTASVQWCFTVYIFQVNTWLLRHSPKELP